MAKIPDARELDALASTGEQVSAALVSLLALTAPAAAQTPNNPFFGSAPQGTATAESLPLSLKDAVERALKYNLGLLLQEESVKTAHGARWRALALVGSSTARDTRGRRARNRH